MIVARAAFATAFASAALTVGGQAAPVSAASLDGTDVVRSVANEAADLLAEEIDLIARTNPRSGASPAEITTLLAQLRSVDGRGHTTLVQLRGLGVRLTPAIESTLDRLPDESAPSTGAGVPLVPRSVVYDAAISDLARIVATPEAVAPVDAGPDGPSYRLLLIAAALLVVLGGAAFIKALVSRPERHEPELVDWNDSLTGLASRRRLDHDLTTNEREGRPTGVIMVDIDSFRSVNDHHGERVGDEILRRFGTLLAHHVRTDDIVYRSGGAEFCVLLPGADADESRVVANRLVRAAHEITLPNGATLTVSVGAAQTHGANISGTVVEADQARRLAKRLGRDRAVFADDIELLAS